MLWVVSDAFKQLDALLAHKAALQGHENKIDTGATRADLLVLAKSLDKNDVREDLLLLQKWFQRFITAAELVEALDELTDLYHRYAVRVVVDKNTGKPSTQDKAATVDDVRDDSAEFFLLDTLHAIMFACHQRDPLDGLSKVPDRMYSFCFKLLHHSQTVAVRHAAARALGVLSHASLAKCVGMFILKAQGCKKDAELREFASYQQAVGQLHFSFAGKSADPTLDYLQKLTDLMGRADRGVLRAEICNTLVTIFSGLLDRKDPVRVREWELIITKPAKLELFWRIYRAVYDIVGKWSRKTKHALYCFPLMVKMLVMGSEKFFSSTDKRDDVFALMVAGLKKSDLRQKCLELITTYIKEVPEVFIQKDMQGFTQQLTVLTEAVLVKNKTVGKNVEEQARLTDLLVEVARKHMHFFVNEVVVPALDPKKGTKAHSFSPLILSLILKALAAVASESPDAIRKYDYALGPTTAPLIENSASAHAAGLHDSASASATSSSATASLLTTFGGSGGGSGPTPSIVLRAALKCFPFVRQPSVDRAAQTAGHVGQLTLDSDREIANNAALALQQWVVLDPHSNLIPSIFYFVDLLRQVDQVQPEGLLKTCQNILYLFDSVKERVQGDKFADIAEWVGLRHHLEALTLIWMAHPELWVRSEVCRLIQLFAKPSFRRVEQESVQRWRNVGGQVASTVQDAINQVRESKTNATDPLLCDIIDDKRQFEPAEQFPWEVSKQLITLLQRHYERFQGLITWAWFVLHPRVAELQRKGGNVDTNSEWYQLWRNHMLFLCLTLRPAPEVYKDRQVDVSRYPELSGDHVESKTTDAFKHTYIRPTLESFCMSGPLVDSFVSQVVQILLDDNVSHAIKSDLVTSLAQCDMCCFPMLASAMAKAGRGGSRKSSGFFYHPHIVAFFAKMYAKVSLDEYFALSEKLQTHLFDFVHTWTKEHDVQLFHGMSVQTRLHVARMMEMFLRVVNHDSYRDKDQREVVCANRAVYFMFLKDKHILPERDLPGPVDSLVEELEVAFVDVMTAMFALGAINQQPIEDEMLQCIQQCPARGSHVEQAVRAALETMLYNNPTRLRDFIKLSSPKEAEKKEPPPVPHRGKGRKPVRSASIVLNSSHTNFVHRDTQETTSRRNTLRVPVLYLRAVTDSLCNSTTFWVPHRVHPSSLVVLAMLHMFSHQSEARLCAVELARTLKRYSALPFDPGYELSLHTHESPFLYGQFALNYSAALAKQPRYYKYIAFILEEVVFLNQFTNRNQKEMLLRGTLPWISQFGAFLGTLQGSQSSVAVVKAARSILSSMFTLTRQCHGSSVLTYLLNDMWTCVFDYRDAAELVVPEVVDFFVYECMKASVQGGGSASDEALLKMIFVHLTRSSCGKLIVDNLMKEFRVYYDQVPTDPDEFLKYESARREEPEDLSPSEHSAFVLVTNLVYEHGPLFQEHYPLLLQNAAVLFADSPIGRDMLCYLSLVLGIYELSGGRRPKAKAGRSDSLSEHSAASSGTSSPRSPSPAPQLPAGPTSSATPATSASHQQEDITVEKIIKALATHHPAIHHKWTEMAFRWAINSCDNTIATRSFTLYRRLHHEHVGPVYTQRLALTFFFALRNDHYRKVQQCMDIFTLPARERYTWDPEAWQVLVGVGFSMLTFARLDLYQAGLKLMNTMLRANVSERKQRELLLSTSVWTLDEEQSMDEGVVDVMRKGLSSLRTLEGTLEVMEQLALVCGQSWLPNNHVTVLLVLVNAMLNSCALVEQGVEQKRYLQAPETDCKQPMDDEKLHRRNRSVVQLLEVHAKHASEQEGLLRRLSGVFQLFTGLSSPLPSPSKGAQSAQPRRERRRSLGQSIANLISGSSNPTPPPSHKGIADLQGVLRGTYKGISPSSLLAVIESSTRRASTESTSSPPTSPDMKGLSGPPMVIPTSQQPLTFIQDFFQLFFLLFPELHSFDFMFEFFVEFLRHGETQWNKTLLLMLGAFLGASQHMPNAEQLKQISELLIRHFYSVDDEVRSLAEQICQFLVVNRANPAATDTFNFVRNRVRHGARRDASEDTLLQGCTHDEVQDQKEVCLERIERRLFGTLKAMSLRAVEMGTEQDIETMPTPHSRSRIMVPHDEKSGGVLQGAPTTPLRRAYSSQLVHSSAAAEMKVATASTASSSTTGTSPAAQPYADASQPNTSAAAGPRKSSQPEDDTKTSSSGGGSSKPIVTPAPAAPASGSVAKETPPQAPARTRINTQTQRDARLLDQMAQMEKLMKEVDDMHSAPTLDPPAVDTDGDSDSDFGDITPA